MKSALALVAAALAAVALVAVGLPGAASDDPETAKWNVCVAEKGEAACKEAWSQAAAKKAKWDACVAEKGEAACKEEWQKAGK